MNGQLLLCMLAEKLVDNIDKLTMLQVNTDGMTVRIPRKHKSILETICKEWETLTNLELEYFYYDRMIIRDVNTYIGVYTDVDKYPKLKGFFEIDREPHKDHSMKIVRKALFEYYVNGKDYKDYITNHTDVKDFFKAVKSIKGSKFELHWFENRELQVKKLTKTVRYIVTNSNNKLIKVLPPLEGKKDSIEKIKESNPNQINIFDFVDDNTRIELNRDSEVEAGYNCDIYNKYDPTLDISQYNINYDYYIKECEKIIKKIGKIT